MSESLILALALSASLAGSQVCLMSWNKSSIPSRIAQFLATGASHTHARPTVATLLKGSLTSTSTSERNNGEEREPQQHYNRTPTPTQPQPSPAKGPLFKTKENSKLNPDKGRKKKKPTFTSRRHSHAQAESFQHQSDKQPCFRRVLEERLWHILELNHGWQLLQGSSIVGW